MKPIYVFFTSLVIVVWTSLSFGVEPTSPEDLIDIPKPSAPIPKVRGKVYRVSPKTIENCEGWVRLRFVESQDITNGNFDVLASKPSGKYDNEALNALIEILSYQRPKYNSGLVTLLDESGHEYSVFTYAVKCDNVEEIDM